MYKTQEFATLCETTKETLFHYDRLGLLKPDRVLKNGYRYYSYNKYLDFLFLSGLKNAGCSLKDIETIFKDGTSKANISAFQERTLQISNQIEKLEKEKVFFEVFSEELSQMQETEKNKIIITKLPKQSFSLIELSASSEAAEKDNCEQLFDRFSAKPLVPPYGLCLNNEALSNGKWEVEGYLFIKGTFESETKLKVKKGKFAVWYGTGGQRVKISTSKKFLTAIKEEGLEIQGEVICMTMLEYLHNGNEKDQVFKLFVPVG